MLISKHKNLLLTALTFIFVTTFQISGLAETRYKNIQLPTNLHKEQIVLVVEGKIRKANPVKLDFATLLKFPVFSFSTFDPWDKTSRTYEGLRLIDLLEWLEIDHSATRVEILARNEYRAIVSIKDLERFGYLLSFKMDNKYYKDLPSNKDKGPLAIAIDFDSQSGIDVEIYKQHMVWWVKQIIVK